MQYNITFFVSLHPAYQTMPYKLTTG